MEPYGSSPHSQQPSTRPHPEPDLSSPGLTPPYNFFNKGKGKIVPDAHHEGV